MADSTPVRVVRVLEYVGPRDVVAQTLANSIRGQFAMGAMQDGAPMIVTAAILSDAEVTPAIDRALTQAREETAHWADLGADACEALGWERPSTPSERTIAAEHARAALEAPDASPPRRANPRQLSRWPAFRDKVREIATARAAANEGADDAQDRR